MRTGRQRKVFEASVLSFTDISVIAKKKIILGRRFSAIMWFYRESIVRF